MTLWIDTVALELMDMGSADKVCLWSGLGSGSASGSGSGSASGLGSGMTLGIGTVAYMAPELMDMGSAEKVCLWSGSGLGSGSESGVGMTLGICTVACDQCRKGVFVVRVREVCLSS